MDLYQHQKDALEKMHNGCILWGGVGSGKSRVALEYYRRNESPKDIYIITTAKKRDSLDWESEAVLIGLWKTADSTLHGVLTVDSWNNLHKYTGVEDAFFVFDEQRLVGSGAWVRSFLRITRRNTWILLSATPGDTWIDYIPVLVARGYYRNRTEFFREHVIQSRFARYPKIERFIGEGKLIRLRKEILVEMPYEKLTTRVSKIVKVDYNKEDFALVSEQRWHPYEDRPLRDAGELFYIMRKIVNSDPSRLEAVRKLMEKHPRLIIFYNFDYELEALRTLSDVIAVAEWNGHKHEDIPNTESWVYLVQYTAGSEGWNCTETDSMIFYSLTYSYKSFHQAHGRIDRLNNNYVILFYYVLLSNSYIDKAVISALNKKKSFNEAQIRPYFL